MNERKGGVPAAGSREDCMQDLFSSSAEKLAPLADRMRPRTLAEFIGQNQIVGEGKLLRRAIEADRLTSSIFWGLTQTRQPS